MSTKPEYVAEGELAVPVKDFNNWLISFLPKGPFYAVSVPIFPDETTMKVAYRESTISQPNPPLPPS